MKYKLSIITVTYKPDHIVLTQCIDSILKYNDIGDLLQIIIVDNSPTNESIIPSFQKKYKNIVFIPAPENKGFGYSNNIGVKASNSDYILIFNNDTEIIEPIFSRLIRKLEKNPLIGCIGIKQAYGYPSFFKRPESKISYIKMKRDIANGKYNNHDYFIPGAFMFMKTSVFIEAGMFDENIFMYHEDPDLCKRILNKGYEIIYDSQISFFHKTGQRHSFSDKTYKISLESYIYYMEKYNYNHLIKPNLLKTIRFMKIKGLVFLLLFKKNIAFQLFKGASIHKSALDNYLKKISQ